MASSRKSARPPRPSVSSAAAPPPNAINQVQFQKVQHVRFEGPIPPPDVLSSYDDISPGFANRIILMAEAEQAHRHGIERSAITQTFDEVRRGQQYGLAIGLFAILAGAVTSIMGYPWSGAVMGGGGVIGLVSVFVLGRFFPTAVVQGNHPIRTRDQEQDTNARQ